jgi:melanoma-associated antigen p97
MEGLIRLLVFAFIIYLSNAARPTRWCVFNTAEEIKCNQLRLELDKAKTANTTLRTLLPETFQCIRTFDVFTCMAMIERDEADLINLDSGLAYFSGRVHNMMPIMAEDYGYAPSSVGVRPTYYSVAMFKSDDQVTLTNLNQKTACFSTIGMSAGWVFPIGQLLRKNYITVDQCNAIVKSVAGFFKGLCLPGSLTSFYNPFGNNPTSVCDLCSGKNEEFCATSDDYAGYDGAFKCVAAGNGQLTFLRHDTIAQMTGPDMNNNQSAYPPENFRLLCPDGTSNTVDSFETCNWGEVTSNVIMTSAVRDPETLDSYKSFLLLIEQLFGPTGTSTSKFKLFRSESSYPEADVFKQTLTRRNLMFTDMTKKFKDIGDETYYTWVGTDFPSLLNEMNRCPSNTIRWCLTSLAEKFKCEDMIMAFKAKELRPEMDCLYGGNTTNCMDMIWRGDADLINLDAGDIYIAGRRYGLVPIAAEDYGDMSMQFKVVAAARKTDKYTTLFNMRGKRACQPGINRGDGWIIPLNIYIETEQFLPTDCSIFRNIGELFSRSCIPGALDSEYNPNVRPINLCEACGGGGFRKCQRNGEEQYYGASGAFRCLVEKGGDVAFVRHLTVRDNTDGRNHAIWARNRRSDDYELMCKDGRRLNVDRFAECHLGYVPSNAIVTSADKSPIDKEIMWNLLNYGQQFFSSDIDGDFHMFDSGIWYTDLIFTDAAVRLMKIPKERQNYKAWLGESFLAQIENLQKYTCVNPDSGMSLSPSLLLSLIVTLVTTFLIML